MRYLSINLILLVFVAFAGCSSTEPTAENKKYTFKTGSVPANFSLNKDALADTGEIHYFVISECRGPDCTPEEAKLSFNLQSGSNKTYLSNRNLSINADDSTYKWFGREWTNIYNSPPVTGNIKTVTLTWDELQHISSAKKVIGSLSGSNFEWSFENRKPMREMIARIESHHRKIN